MRCFMIQRTHDGPYHSFRIGTFLIYVLMALLQAQTLYGVTYYVAPTGNDTNPGTEARPWKTIQKAADTMTAGDTVYIKAGTYHERILPQHSGQPNHYIEYTSYPGNVVIIDGTGIALPEWGGLFDISGKSYLKISDLRIINVGPNLNNIGILVDQSSHIMIENNHTYNTMASGIGIWHSTHITLHDNEVEFACNDGSQECISVVDTDTFEVKYNHVHHSGPGTHGGEGIDILDGSSNGKVHNNYIHHINRVGIYVDAWKNHTSHIEIFQNIVHDCAASGIALASESGGLLENIVIHNNLVYHNKTCGLGIYNCCSSLASLHPMRWINIINNTFYNNGWEPWGAGICVKNPDIEHVIIRNNICSQNVSFQIQVETDVPMGTLTVDHNLIDGYSGAPGDIYGTEYVEGNPRFKATSQADFHLQADSPAIDKGSSLSAPDDDFEGDPRPQGIQYDIGADEYFEPTSFLLWQK